MRALLSLFFIPMCCFCNNTISLLSYNIYHDVKIAETSNSYNIIEAWDKRKDQVLDILKYVDYYI